MKQSLFKVTFNYQSYNEKNGPIKKTRELFLDSKNPEVNTCRLSGFENATISDVRAELIRDKQEIEIDIDIERNEIDATICGQSFLDSTLNKCSDLSGDEDEIIEQLESQGYVQVVHDNNYNSENDLDETYDFKVFDLDQNSEWYYSDTAIILIRKHVGLDVRAGYEFIGAFRGLDYDGMVHFLDRQVRFDVMDRLGEEVDQYESVYSMLNDYKIVGYDQESQSIKLEREGNTFVASYYNPVYGV